MTFTEWFEKLVQYAADRHVHIEEEDKESYRDYYDDGDSAEDTFDHEAKVR